MSLLNERNRREDRLKMLPEMSLDDFERVHAKVGEQCDYAPMHRVVVLVATPVSLQQILQVIHQTFGLVPTTEVAAPVKVGEAVETGVFVSIRKRG